MDAIILCGGLGKRLRPRTETIPKAMVEIKGKPLVDYQIEWLRRNGITRIILACGYQWESLKGHLGDSVIYSVEREPLGTAGAVKNALRYVTTDRFVVCNVDDLNDVDINEAAKIGKNTICLSQLRSPFGVVHTDHEKVIRFEEKPLLDIWVSMGVYILDKTIERALPLKGDLEKEVFPKISLFAYKHTGMWRTANTQKDLEEIERII